MNETFEGGKNYTLHVGLLANSGYTFKKGVKDIYINDKKIDPANLVKPLGTDQTSSLSLDLKFVCPSIIGSIGVKGIEHPVEGKRGDTKVTDWKAWDSNRYIATNVKWGEIFEKREEFSYDEIYEPLTGEEWTFEEGHTYYADITLTAKEGEAF